MGLLAVVEGQRAALAQRVVALQDDLRLQLLAAPSRAGEACTPQPHTPTATMQGRLGGCCFCCYCCMPLLLLLLPSRG